MSSRCHFVLSNRVRKLRCEKGLTQEALAKSAMTTQNTISSIETGQYSPTAFTALMICIALGCSFDDCFYMEVKLDE